MSTQKIEWLSVLKGWSMLLVVIGHVNLTHVEGDPSVPIYNFIHILIYSFHMPLFMFISGYLYYYTRISNNSPFGKTLIEKLKRFGIPLLFFTSATILPKIIFAPLMKSPVDLSWRFFVDTFILYKTNPLGEMWFIISLIVLMMFYPLYKFSLTNIYYIILTLIISVLLFFYFPSIHVFQLRAASEMLLFFYGGILFSKYNLQRFCNTWVSLLLSLVFFIILHSINTPAIILVFIGIIFSLSLCMNLVKFFPELFISFRDYIFQIYLMAIFFQMCAVYIYAGLNFTILYWPLVFVSVFAGIYIPTFIGKIIKKIDNKLLNYCFGL